jgi:hypothetical protein
MISDLWGSAVLRHRSILSRVAIKPFNNNYTLETPDGTVVINGEQITKIIAKKVFVYGEADLKWSIIFYLSDGSYYTADPGDWTEDFAKNLGV